MFFHPFLDRPILRRKCGMPLGIFRTTNAYLWPGKYTFSYSPLVLSWPPLSHFIGKRGIFIDLPMVSTSFKITYNIPNIGKKALRQGSRQFLLCRHRHLQLPLPPLASWRQTWLGTGLDWACHFMCACTPPSKIKTQRNAQNPYAGYGQARCLGSRGTDRLT